MSDEPWKLSEEEWGRLAPVLEGQASGTIGDRVCAEIVLEHHLRSSPGGQGRRKAGDRRPGSYASAHWKDLCRPHGISASTAVRRYKRWTETGAWTEFWLELQRLRAGPGSWRVETPTTILLRRFEHARRELGRPHFRRLPHAVISLATGLPQGAFVPGQWSRGSVSRDGLVLPRDLEFEPACGVLLHHMVHQALGDGGCGSHSKRFQDEARRVGLGPAQWCADSSGERALLELSPEDRERIASPACTASRVTSPLIRVLEHLDLAFDRFNSLCFGGVLQQAALFFEHLDGPWGAFGIDPWAYGGEDHPRITLEYELLGAPPERLLAVLLHEMVHQRNAHLGLRDTSRRQYHNRHFRDTALLVGLKCEHLSSYGYAHTGFSPPGRRVLEDVLRYLPTRVLGWRVSPPKERATAVTRFSRQGPAHRRGPK